MNLEKTGVGKITGVLAAGGVLIYLLSFFYPLFRACPLNITEFENAAFALLMAREGLAAYQPLYHDLATVGYYGPLFYAIPAAAGRAAGLTQNPEYFLFLIRGMTYLFAVMSAALLGSLTSRISGERVFGWLSAAVFLSLPWFMQGARPDFPAFFCVFLAITIVVRSGRSRSFVNIAAGLLCAAAVLHLQRAGAFAAAYGIVLLFFERRFAQALVFGSVFLTAVLLPVVILEVLTQGNFLTHSLEFLSLVSEPRTVFLEVWRLKAGRPLQLFIGVCLIVCALMWKKRDSASVLAGAYFIVSIALSLVTTRSVGAAANHFLEPIAAGLLMFAAASRHSRGVKTILAFFLVVFFLRGMFLQFHSLLDPSYGYAAKGLCIEDTRAAGSLPSGPLLSDYSFLPYLTGHADSAIAMIDWAQRLAPKGRYDPEVTRKRIREKYYASAAIGGNPFFKDMFADDLAANYEKSFNIGGSEIFLPRNRLPEDASAAAVRRESEPHGLTSR